MADQQTAPGAFPFLTASFSSASKGAKRSFGAAPAARGGWQMTVAADAFCAEESAATEDKDKEEAQRLAIEDEGSMEPKPFWLQDPARHFAGKLL